MNLYIKLLIVLILSIPFISNGQDRCFAWTYNSTVLAKGAKDLEAWDTYRTGRNYFYKRLDTRLELEVGLSNKLQTSLYFNGSHFNMGASLDTLGGIADTSFSGTFSESAFSFSSEWKYKISDAVLNKIGFSLYGEITAGPSEFELEGKLIFDKKTDKNVFALNLVAEHETEYEVEKGVTKFHRELKLESDLAYMHFFRPAFGLGLEGRMQIVMEEGEAEHGALFAGPTLFWSGEKYFLILNAHPQLMNLLKSDENPGSLDLAEYEKFSVRLLLGFSL